MAISKNEVWAVSLKPKTYQSHCLIKMTFDLTFSRLPIIYRKSRRQEQEICFLLTLYVFAKMSPSFLLWKEISSPEILYLLDVTAFKRAQVFIAPTWQMSNSCKYTEKVRLQEQGNPPYALLLKCGNCSRTLIIIFLNI